MNRIATMSRLKDLSCMLVDASHFAYSKCLLGTTHTNSSVVMLLVSIVSGDKIESSSVRFFERSVGARTTTNALS